MAQVRASRSTVIGAAAWLAVVLVCSTLVWTVISRAGEGVTADEPSTRGPSTSIPRDTSTLLVVTALPNTIARRWPPTECS